MDYPPPWTTATCSLPPVGPHPEILMLIRASSGLTNGFGAQACVLLYIKAQEVGHVQMSDQGPRSASGTYWHRPSVSRAGPKQTLVRWRAGCHAGRQDVVLSAVQFLWPRSYRIILWGSAWRTAACNFPRYRA